MFVPLDVFKGNIDTFMFVSLEIFKGNIDTFMITIIVCFLGHNGSEDSLRLSQVHMIDETWDNWFNVQYNLTEKVCFQERYM